MPPQPRRLLDPSVGRAATGQARQFPISASADGCRRTVWSFEKPTTIVCCYLNLCQLRKLPQLCSAHRTANGLHYLPNTTNEFGSPVDVVLNCSFVSVTCAANKVARQEVCENSIRCAVIVKTFSHFPNTSCTNWIVSLCTSAEWKSFSVNGVNSSRTLSNSIFLSAEKVAYTYR